VGGRAFLSALELDIQAAVDCYGAFVVGTPPEGFPLQVRPLADRVGELRAPVLGLFGNEDSYPSPEQVDELEKLLQAHGKSYEFHRYDGAGHAFFSVDRPSYRVAAALDGWRRVAAFFGKHLAGRCEMCTYRTEKVDVSGSSGKGSEGWFPLRTATVYYDHPVHAPDEHTVNIDFLNPDRGPSARVGGGAEPEAARELLSALQLTVERAGRR
jgi:hypothetical protein